MLQALAEYTEEELRAVAEQSGLDIPADAEHGEIAHRLVREKYRTGVDDLYQVGDDAFLNVDEYLPFLIGFIAKYKPRRVTEFGCGAGKLALLLQDVLPPDGAYLGSDYAEAGVRRAEEKVRGDARFSFAVADAVEAPILEDTDCLLFPWVMNWLDTHAIERIWMRLAAIRPAPLVISVVSFRSCVERRAGGTRDDMIERAAAEHYVAGDPDGARAIWNTERYDVYVQSMKEHFDVIEENVQPGAHIFWAKRSRSA